jgi:transposase
MSLRPQPIGSIPEQTARVAHAAFPKGHPYLTLRDHLGTIFQDADFAALFPAWGYPGLPPWRLALVTIMQFRAQLSDRQAAEAVRARIDWKYLLGLELTDPGFDFSVLCEFRDRLLAGSAAALLVDKLLATVSHHGVAPSTRPATHRLDPRARGHSCDEPPRTGRRNSPGCAQCVGHGCTHVAPSAGPSHMVRALWHAD